MATGWPMKTTYANGDVYSASDVNDITGTINLLGKSVAYTAGKNVILNGDMRISQRGTSFSNPANFAYLLDRYAIYYDGTGATRTISQQTFTPGTAPVSGYEGANFFRYAQTVAGTSNTVNLIYQRIEDVRTFAGTSAVLSFWAKADTTRTVTASARQYFGSGGSGDVNTSFTGSASLTTSWQRFSFTISVPSISGKTIGTSSALEIQLSLPAGTTPTIDIWGVQLEQGSTATAFQTATGTIQGELAACQRYYWRNTSISATSGFMWMGIIANYYSATRIDGYINFPVRMRTIPSSVDFSNIAWIRYWGAGVTSISAVTINTTGTSDFGGILQFTTTGASTADPALAYYILSNNSAGYVGLSAEL